MLHFLSPNRLRTCENSKTPIPPQPKAAMRSIGPALRSPAGLLFAALALAACSEAPSASNPESAADPASERSRIEASRAAGDP